MITKDINGNNLSANYATTVQADSRQWLAKLLLNGTELSCAIKGFTITKGASGNTESFTAGAIVSSMLEAELLELTDNVKGEEIEVQIGLEVGGSYEWISLGKFTGSEVSKSIYSTTITAYGACVSKTVGDFTSPQDMTPAQALTIANIIAEIATETGVTVSVDAGIDQTAEFTLPMSGLTTYQALQAVVQAVGGYAVDTYDGNIAIKLFDDTPVISVSAGLMKTLPAVEETDYAITGVAVNTAGGLLKSSTAINYLGDAQWLTSAMFSDYESALVGYTYRPGSIDLSLGDPRLEGGDVLTVVDANSSTYVVPCHQIVHTYDGGFASQITASQAPNIDNDVATPSPVSSGIQDAKDMASEALQAVADIGDTAQYFWHTTTDTGAGAGSHITQIPQVDFLNDPANGGGNTLLTSTGMQIRDGLTDLAKFTADGAQIGKTSQGDSLFFQVVDLRGGTGEATVKEYFAPRMIDDNNALYLSAPATTTDYSVEVNGTEASNVTKYTDRVVFGFYPSGEILVTYTTTSDKAKEYTMGKRSGDAGMSSVAEGYDAEASGTYSHAQNLGTIARGKAQTAIGKYNIANPYYPLIIGNGTDDNNRSNALMVSTNGDIIWQSDSYPALWQELINKGWIVVMSDPHFSIQDVLIKILQNLPLIEYGSVDMGTCQANSITNVPVLFDYTFPSTPTVVCSIYSTSTSPTLGSFTASAINVNTQGFTMRVFNNTSSNRTPVVKWIAMCGGGSH